MEKIRVANGIFWVAIPEVDMYILCGCPADSVKHLMRRGLIIEKEKDGVSFESGPNAILLSDTTTQKGGFSNLGEFPVLQMLYRQGMILPGHPNNTGRKPMLIGLQDQVRSQSLYIYRGNYGLANEEELVAAGASAEEARAIMRAKRWFAFDNIRATEDLLDLRVMDQPAVELRDGVFIRRRGFNQYEFLYGGDSVRVDLNLAKDEEYGPTYTLGFHRLHKEYFSVIHIGEGDGWNQDRPCMGSIIVFQGRIYLMDAGPHITHSLTALGIGINEIEGIFQSHCHDDHFAGLTSLIRSDHRIKYFAIPLVRASVVKKYIALTGGVESDFTRYFDVKDLATDSWNSIDGLQVMPRLSLHPVETSVFSFRALWEGGYKTYTHLADIVSFDVLSRMRTDDPAKSGVDLEHSESYMALLRDPADLKKIDAGGGPIHGNARDFTGDASKRIILSHLSNELSDAEKEIGSSASFGHDDVLIPAHGEYLLLAALEHLRAYFPGVPEHDILMLANCPQVELNPGTILLRGGEAFREIYLIVSGVVEYIDSKAGLRNVLSAGALMGELSDLQGETQHRTFRAASHVSAIRIPREIYTDIIHRNSLDDTIRQVHENRKVLQDSWLFGEVVSYTVQHKIAKLMKHVTAGEGESVWAGKKNELFLLADGLVTIFAGSKPIENVRKGGFFGEEAVINRSSGIFEARVTYDASLFTIPGEILDEIPIVHWKLAETFERRLKSFRTEFTFEWRDVYMMGIPTLDDQHERLFSMISTLTKSLETPSTAASLDKRTADLVREVRAHLEFEEELIRTHSASDADAQRKKHDAFVAELGVVRGRIPQTPDTAVGEMLDLLKDWIIDHTLLENLKNKHLLMK